MGLPFWVNAIGRPVVTVTTIEGRREPLPEKAWSPQRKNVGRRNTRNLNMASHMHPRTQCSGKVYYYMYTD